jgi:hypothetical protein
VSTFQILTVIIAAVGAGGALAALARGLIEYREQGKQKRAAQFLDLRYRFVTNETFSHIADLIDLATLPRSQDSTNDALANLPLNEKRRYVGFFEDVALATYSGMIAPELANYMFGYYALACWDSHAFWSGEIGPKAHPYWALFALFCRDMARHRESFEQRCADDGYIRKALSF